MLLVVLWRRREEGKEEVEWDLGFGLVWVGGVVCGFLWCVCGCFVFVIEDLFVCGDGLSVIDVVFGLFFFFLLLLVVDGEFIGFESCFGNVRLLVIV